MSSVLIFSHDTLSTLILAHVLYVAGNKCAVLYICVVCILYSYIY